MTLDFHEHEEQQRRQWQSHLNEMRDGPVMRPWTRGVPPTLETTMPKTKRVHNTRIVTIDAAESRAFDTIDDILESVKVFCDDDDLVKLAGPLQTELVTFRALLDAQAKPKPKQAEAK